MVHCSFGASKNTMRWRISTAVTTPSTITSNAIPGQLPQTPSLDQSGEELDRHKLWWLSMRALHQPCSATGKRASPCVSVAAKKGAISAGGKAPLVWLRDGLLATSRGALDS